MLTYIRLSWPARINRDESKVKVMAWPYGSFPGRVRLLIIQALFPPLQLFNSNRLSLIWLENEKSDPDGEKALQMIFPEPLLLTRASKLVDTIPLEALSGTMPFPNRRDRISTLFEAWTKSSGIWLKTEFCTICTKALWGAGQTSCGENFVNSLTEYANILVSSPADRSIGTPKWAHLW